jgi:hypothetical protein
LNLTAVVETATREQIAKEKKENQARLDAKHAEYARKLGKEAAEASDSEDDMWQPEPVIVKHGRVGKHNINAPAPVQTSDGAFPTTTESMHHDTATGSQNGKALDADDSITLARIPGHLKRAVPKKTGPFTNAKLKKLFRKPAMEKGTFDSDMKFDINKRIRDKKEQKCAAKAFAARQKAMIGMRHEEDEEPKHRAIVGKAGSDADAVVPMKNYSVSRDRNGDPTKEARRAVPVIEPKRTTSSHLDPKQSTGRRTPAEPKLRNAGTLVMGLDYSSDTASMASEESKSPKKERKSTGLRASSKSNDERRATKQAKRVIRTALPDEKSDDAPSTAL